MNTIELNPIEILEKLDTFYNNAWEKLIIYNTVFLAVIGIIVPFIIQWWQSRNIKLREEVLKKELTDLFEAKTKEFQESIIKAADEKFKVEVEAIEKNLEKIKSGLEGSHFHLQANSESDGKERMKSLIWAAQGYVKGDDLLNLIPVLEMIISLIPKLSKEDMSDIFVEDADIDALIKMLEEMGNTDTFIHLVRKIKILISKMPEKNIIRENTAANSI